MATGKRDLVVLATQIAEQLVGAALDQLLGDARQASSVVIVNALPAAAPQRALPPGPEPKRRRRKPGSKPGRRRGPYKKRATDVAPSRPVPADSTTEPDITSRKCRNCFTQGQTTRVPGTDRQVRCGKCGFKWKIRVQASEKGEVSTPAIVKDMRRPQAAQREACCGRCDHDQSAHEQSKGRCLVPRCVCSEFYK